MRKSLNKLNPFKKAKPVATAGSSSTSLSSDQQRTNDRQLNAPAEIVQPSANTAPTLAAPGNDNGQSTPVEASGLIASAAAIVTAPTRHRERNDPSAESGEPLAVTAPAIVIGKEDNYGIKVLYSSASAVIDIVFIHGLTGSAYTTWLHEESGRHWPRDLLKNDFNDARIMTFGYDADVVNFWGHAALEGISGYANDLLGCLAGCREGVSVRMTSIA
jgi:hypothetical protein